MKIRPYLFSLLALGFALMLSLAIGSVFLSPAQLWAALTGHGTQTSDTILWAIRFPRTALILVNGYGTRRKRRDISGFVPQSAG